jgi:monofunctional biosynthetic peptidoglycan transglycosylase
MTEIPEDEIAPPRKRRVKKVDGEEPGLRKKAAPRKPRAKAPVPILPEADPDKTIELPQPREHDESLAAPKPSVRRRLTRLGLKYGSRTLLVFALLSTLWILAYRFINPPVTPLMILRHFGEEEDLRKRWRGGEEIAPEFLLAVVAAEDQMFFQHSGFDWKQIGTAIDERLKGGRLRGGSTISQQVAKNVFLWPGRSWLRKGLEAWFTVGIELCWSKERILEVYVNVAEMGRGIYGVEAAAQHYFQKPAAELTRSECALLATVLPDPRDRSPLKPTGTMRERQDWILKQMRNLGGVEFLEQSQRAGEPDGTP